MTEFSYYSPPDAPSYDDLPEDADELLEEIDQIRLALQRDDCADPEALLGRLGLLNDAGLMGSGIRGYDRAIAPGGFVPHPIFMLVGENRSRVIKAHAHTPALMLMKVGTRSEAEIVYEMTYVDGVALGDLPKFH